MKVVVQCSGGIESTAMIALAIEEAGKENVYLIAYDDDSSVWKSKEHIAVKRVVTAFQLQQNLFICKMPQTDYLEYRGEGELEASGLIPGFKLLFNAAALAYAQRVGAEEVWIGNMKENVFKDESFEFDRKLEDLYHWTYTEKPIRIVTPFMNFTKAGTITLATNLGVDLSDTMSCSDERVGGSLNCGVCDSCHKRRKGFAEAQIADPTRYWFAE